VRPASSIKHRDKRGESCVELQHLDADPSMPV